MTSAEISAKQYKKAADFVRLAQKRVPKIIKAIRGLHPLASANYFYTEEQVERILSALQVEIIVLKDVLGKKKQDNEVDFKL